MRYLYTFLLFFLSSFFPGINVQVKRSFVFAFLLFPFLSFSQTLSLNVVNQGLSVKNTNDSVVIFGNVVHRGTPQGSLQDGLIENDGHFYISGDWQNDNGPTGQIFVTGHTGWIHLDSAVQTIKGDAVTQWNKLELGGNSGSTKFLVNVDTRVEDTLALNNHEFNADVNTVHSLSVDTFKITRSSGFVSSLDEGGLARNTASTSTYVYPVGSSVGTLRYRPVDIKPTTTDPNTYKVRMANNDPGLAPDTYDRATKEATVGDINDKYYHKVSRTNGITPIDITVYYKPDSDNIDGNFDILAYWADVSEWHNPGEVGTEVPVSGNPYYDSLVGLTTRSFDFFTTTPSTPVALSYDVIIDGEIYVANVFSPNGDGKNDFLFAHGKGLLSVEVVVYDRWGAKVFETNDITQGWDGTKNGDPLNTAVFVYVVRGKFKNGDEVVKKGNITLLR